MEAIPWGPSHTSWGPAHVVHPMVVLGVVLHGGMVLHLGLLHSPAGTSPRSGPTRDAAHRMQLSLSVCTNTLAAIPQGTQW